MTTPTRQATGATTPAPTPTWGPGNETLPKGAGACDLPWVQVAAGAERPELRSLFHEDGQDVELHHVEEGGASRIRVLIDSGAAESVAPSGLIKLVPVTRGKAAQSRVHYLTADGGRIPNLGEQSVKVVTKEGHECGLRFQVADVTRPLLSVTQLVRSGNLVQFTTQGGTITHRARGWKIKFEKRGGVYALDLEIRRQPLGGSRRANGQRAASGGQAWRP